MALSTGAVLKEVLNALGSPVLGNDNTCAQMFAFILDACT